MKLHPIPLAGFLLLLHFASQCQVSSRYDLLLKSGSYLPAENINVDRVSTFNLTASRSFGKTFAIIQFQELPTLSQRQALQTAGIELLEYLPNYAYTASISRSLDANTLKQFNARALIEPSAVQKMHPKLFTGELPGWALKSGGSVNVWISIARSFDLQLVKNELARLNFDIESDIYKDYRVLSITLSLTRLEELASLPFIEYVEPAPAPDQPFNSNSMFASRANLLKAPVALGGRNLDGSGVTIGVGDNGDVQSHIDFTGRLVNRSANTFLGHASHVAGTIGGAGIVNELYAGYAPKSTIVSQLFSNIISYAGEYVQDHGMVISNNSYGSVTNDCYYNGLYDLTSRILDQQAIDMPELQYVFAAGNDGTRNCTPYPAGFRTVLGGYQSAKNVITVGSTDNKSRLSPFSSKGPVSDGRMKPEVMAPGSFIASTWVNNGYSYSAGTSMAAPGVSGGLALLIQRYRQLHGGNNPVSGLMKALLCNGATDLGNPGADYSYGLGRIDLTRSVDMLEKNRYYQSSVANGITNTHTITVPANTSQIKVLLYWVDPPANVMANKTLVNDLDLQVQTPVATTIFPWLLDSAASATTNNAATGADHFNNIEQVVINNPAAGNYSLKVIGSLVAQNPLQQYILVYDLISPQLTLTNPIGGETLVPTISSLDTFNIQWDTYGDPSASFSLEFRNNDAGSWVMLNDNLSESTRFYSWAVPNIPTEQGRIRLTKNGTGISQTSQPFTITSLLIDSLTPVQCEGYIQLGWRPVVGATDYEAMILRGGELLSAGFTTSLNFVFSGLSKDSVYWVTARPRINGKPGRRGIAVSRQPNSGSCSGNISNNDLKIDSILSPRAAGRLFTSTAFTNNTPITIRIRNLDDQPSTEDITLSYSINGGPPVTSLLSSPLSTIAANSYLDYTFPVNSDLSAIGSYTITVSANKVSDPVPSNNSFSAVSKQLNNPAINLPQLPWMDDLETLDLQTLNTDQMGLLGNDRYDFVNSTIYGRLRSFVNSGIARSGNRAITMDADRFTSGGNVDSLTATINLATINPVTTDLRLDFRYKHHGQVSHAANKVWIRGHESLPWIEVLNLNNIQGPAGVFQLVPSVEISDSLLAHGQSLTESFQVRWGQWGTHMTSDNRSRAGYTIDDIRILNVTNDLQTISIDTPIAVSCGLNNSVPVKVSIRNTSNTLLSNVPVILRVDGVIAGTETIPSIPASSSIQYSFVSASANLLTAGNHVVEVWVNHPGDSYRENDTARITVNNLPLISSFPYLQDFELTDGGWYKGGTGSSWGYGTPISPRIKRAASGIKAWKTNIAGYYQDFELSYLYSPCFDLTGMTNPTLSFSLALDIEDCGTTLCDAAWVEYSNDNGISWTKLGNLGQGTNWYNKDYAGNQLWSKQDYHRWHVATTALPVTNNNKLRLRFVFDSDDGVTKDGIAIDDIHVYDNIYGIYDGPTMSTSVSQNMNGGNNWIHFLNTGKLVASINPNNQVLGNTQVQAFINPIGVRNFNGQYYHDRNLTIKPSLTQLSDSAKVRFYFLDAETEALIGATGCMSCTKPSMVTELGVSKYSDPVDSLEDGQVVNSVGSDWSYIHANRVVKVPFDKGYYAEFNVKDFSEFWLHNGGFDGNHTLPLQLLSFTATKVPGNNDVLAEWKTEAEYNVSRFEIELAKGLLEYQQNTFTKIGEVVSQGNSTSEQSYSFIDNEANKTGVRYYRLRIVNMNGSHSYSSVRPVIFTDDMKWQVFPNPSSGIFSLLFQLNQGEKVDINVYDATGRLVHKTSTIATGFVQRANLYLESANYIPGLYLVEATAGKNKKTFKVVKH